MKSLSKYIETVITYDGTPAIRKECRFIKGKFYRINSQCFLINGKYHRINNGRIIYDYEFNKWVHRDSNVLENGLVGIKDGKYILGNFTANPTKNLTFIDGVNRDSRLLCINEDIAELCGGAEEKSSGIFWGEKAIGSIITKGSLEAKKTQPREFYNFPVLHNASTMLPKFTKEFQTYYQPKVIIPAAKQLRGYSWGVEYETDLGTIPERHLHRLGLIACRDGSIHGHEYVTIPLRGTEGISAIISQCEVLNKYCDINNNNSLHVHIGGYPITQESVVALYKGLVYFQDEIYSIIPDTYKHTSIFKRRDYCSPLRKIASGPTLEETFNRIYLQLSGGEPFTGFNFFNHPMDRNGDHKWEIDARYKCVNLIPLLFGRRGTIEFRCHPPTMNADKVINWIFITVGIVKFIEEHQKLFLRKTKPTVIDLSAIMSKCYDESTAATLINYINWRKKLYPPGSTSIGDEEINADRVKLPANCRLI